MSQLPISYDIQFSLSKASGAAARDMTLLSLFSNKTNFLHGERVKLSSTWDGYQKLCTVGDSVYWAGNAFFSKTNRPKRMAVSAIYETDQAAYNLSPSVKLDALKSVTDGAFKITVDGTVKDVASLNFSTVKSVANVAEVLNTAASGAFVASDYNGQLLVKSTTQGANSTISYALAPTTGTDVSSMLGLSESAGASVVDGYAHGTFLEEVNECLKFAGKMGVNIFGFVLDTSYRDTQDQKDFADWVNARSYRADCALVSNNPTAYSATDTTNIVDYCNKKDIANVATFYHDNAQIYPDVAYLAEFLAVNYSLDDQVIDGKYKDIGIVAVNLPDVEANWTVLESKRANTILYVGDTGKKCVRNGDQSSIDWRTDSWINICNFISELEIETLNVFLRNKKVAYTPSGQNLLISAASKIGKKYTKNGSFADREESDDNSENGLSLVPAVEIIPQEISETTSAQRKAGIGTPIQINVNDSGSMRTIALNITVTE
jgi:hypothetical protein